MCIRHPGRCCRHDQQACPSAAGLGCVPYSPKEVSKHSVAAAYAIGGSEFFQQPSPLACHLQLARPAPLCLKCGMQGQIVHLYHAPDQTVSFSGTKEDADT